MEDRYSRQISLKIIGASGQKRLSKATAIVVGCGGLGCTSAGLLARAGIGRLLVADGGKVELSNLHRQVLFGENDIGRPKAMVAAERISAANATVEVVSIVRDIDGRNIKGLLEGVDVLVDGTDRMATRRIINEACVRLGIPWIYGGAARTSGMTMTIVPGRTPCLSCVFPEGPAREDGPLPILNTLPSIIASIQVTEAIKVLIGKKPRPGLLCIDAWDWEARTIGTKVRADCPVCKLKGRRHPKD